MNEESNCIEGMGKGDLYFALYNSLLLAFSAKRFDYIYFIVK